MKCSTKKPQESLKQPSCGPPLVSSTGLQWWKVFFFQDDDQSYLVVRKVLHIEQTNTVSLWASGAKDSEKERTVCKTVFNKTFFAKFTRNTHTCGSHTGFEHFIGATAGATTGATVTAVSLEI